MSNEKIVERLDEIIALMEDPNTNENAIKYLKEEFKTHMSILPKDLQEEWHNNYVNKSMDWFSSILKKENSPSSKKMVQQLNSFKKSKGIK